MNTKPSVGNSLTLAKGALFYLNWASFGTFVLLWLILWQNTHAQNTQTLTQTHFPLTSWWISSATEPLRLSPLPNCRMNGECDLTSNEERTGALFNFTYLIRKWKWGWRLSGWENPHTFKSGNDQTLLKYSLRMGTSDSADGFDIMPSCLVAL